MRARPGAAAPGDPAASSPPGVPASAEETGLRRRDATSQARPIRFGPVVITISDARTGATSRRRAAVDALPVSEVPDTADEYLVERSWGPGSSRWHVLSRCLESRP